MTTEQPEALQLADDLDAEAGRITQYTNSRGDLLRELAAAELRCQHAEIETLRAGYDAARLEIESLQKAATDRHALQATGAHPAPCARYCEAQAFRITLRNLHAENERLRTCNKDAQHEIANLQERVQELGQMARDVTSRRVVELEAQLEAIGAGGVEPLRKRECLHQISEPAQPVAQAQDAARYQFLRDGEWRDTELEPFIRLQLNTMWDAKIDAAIAAQKGSND